jgi:small GTP-binding protein
MGNYECQLKITLCGDTEVGKTSLRARYMGFKFDDNMDYQMTLGVDFSALTYFLAPSNLGIQQKVFLQIWDVGGQLIFKNIRQKYYTGTNGFLFVFDLTNLKSLLSLKEWLSELNYSNEYNKMEEIVPIVILGNKSDLKRHPKLTKAYIRKFLCNLSQLYYDYEFPYLETSAKTGDNINIALDTLINKILEKDAN